MKGVKRKKDVVYFTQNELANRWRVSPATIKNLRESKELPYFSPPGSNRILYPVDEIYQIERDETNSFYKEDKRRKQTPETRVKQPVIPAKSNQDWRI